VIFTVFIYTQILESVNMVTTDSES